MGCIFLIPAFDTADFGDFVFNLFFPSLPPLFFFLKILYPM